VGGVTERLEGEKTRQTSANQDHKKKGRTYPNGKIGVDLLYLDEGRSTLVHGGAKRRVAKLSGEGKGCVSGRN